MEYIKNTINNAYTGVVKQLKAPPTNAQFKETGMLSPDEFIQAGDKLIQVSPQWSWQKAPDSGSQYKYLPADKQFLVLKDCISERRIKDLMKNAQKFMETNTNDGWVIQELDQETNKKNLEEIGKQLQNIDVQNDNFSKKEDEKKEETSQQQQKKEESDGEEKIFTVQQHDSEDEEDNGQAPEVRIYTIYICYDGYYYCPRLFLTAILSSDDEKLDGQPIKLEKIFDDIAAEKVNTTVTIENHPQLNQQMVTIHPCKHAQVLKNFADQIREGRSEDSVGAHLAIILFLKFFHDVIPTVSFDSNFDIDFGAN